jgi:hypothetical protein
MPDSRQQEPGGWNRVLLQVQDLPARIADLKAAGVPFRNEMEVGQVANRFKLKTPTAIRSSCSSLLAIDESQDKRVSKGRYRRTVPLNGLSEKLK